MQEQYTVRIYDTKLVKRINDLYKKYDDFFTTKNQFLVACLTKGVETLERDLDGAKKIQNLDELYEEIHNTAERLNDLIKQSEDNAKEMVANNIVNQKLLSCNYNMLLGISDNAPRKKDFVETGMYDDLPERLEEIFEEILKTYSKK